MTPRTLSVPRMHRRPFRPTAIAALAALLAGAALAQDSNQRVEITGSSIKRIQGETALPVQTITRGDIDKSGVTTAAELLRNISAGTAPLSDGASISDNTGGQRGFNGANLRGLGVSSTLVLLKQTEPANAMLSRLSSFLRYTLANEPAGRVTVAQEVETLKLYLDIEKMRFEDRLRPTFEIDSAVEGARLPSMLLQPLVENAIKYAVTPKEEGADISVTAQLVGQRVRITVSDTGPGLQPGQQDHSLSTGVGMANTRERLSQAYGDDQRFEHYVKAGGGFEVLLELPYQSRIIAGEDNQTGAKQQGTISA